jgi:signal transduction histidine kinase
MKFFICLGLLWGWVLNTKSQVITLNSQKENLVMYQKTQPDYARKTEYIDKLIGLGRAIFDIYPTHDSVILLAQQGEILSKKLAYQVGLAEACLVLALGNRVKGQRDHAIDYAQQAEKLFAKLGNYEKICQAMLVSTYTYLMQSKYQLALNQAFKIRDIQEKHKIPINADYINTHRYIAYIYIDINEPLKAKEYLENALKIAQKQQLKLSEMLVLDDLNEFNLKSGNYEAAKASLHKIIAGYQNLGAIKYLPVTYKVMADVCKELRQGDSAVFYHQKSLAINRKLNDKDALCFSLNALARIQLENGNTAEALAHVQEAIQISYQINKIAHRSVNLGLLSEIYARRNEFEKAFNYHNAHKACSDSILAETNNRAIGRIEAKYEYDKKEADFLQKQKIQQLLTEALQKDNRLQLLENEQVNQKNQLLTSENQRQILSIEKEKTEKTQQRQLLLAEQKRKDAENRQHLAAQRLWTYIALASVGVLLLIVYLIGRNNRQKQKSNQILQAKNREITQQKEEIETQAEQLEGLNAIKNRLFAIIAHDLRSPLTAFESISRQIDFYLKKEQPEKIQALGNKITQSSQNVSKLLDNLLNWALLQNHDFELNPQLIDLQTAVNEAIAPYQHLAEVYQIRIANQIADDLKLWIDVNVFNLIIRNLVNNALKFTPAGGQITLRADAENDKIVLKIQDTGVGIAPEKIGQMFEANPQTTNLALRGEKGLGLGLALCAEFVRRSEGTIEVQSEVQKGSIFSLIFPNKSL